MRSRINRTLTDKETYAMICECFRQSVIQAEAAMLYAMSKHGFGKVRLNRFHEWFKGILTMPEVFGKTVSTLDAIELLKREYGIDCTEISIKFPTYREWKRDD